jgi:hypothetical protein
MEHVRFLGARGGAGTSSVALAFALLELEAGARPVLIPADMADMLSMGGHPSPVEGALSDWSVLDSGIPICHPTAAPMIDKGRWNRVIEDAGSIANMSRPAAVRDWPTYPPTFLVVRGPGFGDLRRARAAVDAGTLGAELAGMVLLAEAGRALGVAEAEQVLGVPVCAILKVDAATARALDAGTFADRVPSDYRTLLRIGELAGLEADR